MEVRCAPLLTNGLTMSATERTLSNAAHAFMTLLDAQVDTFSPQTDDSRLSQTVK